MRRSQTPGLGSTALRIANQHRLALFLTLPALMWTGRLPATVDRLWCIKRVPESASHNCHSLATPLWLVG